MPNPRVCASDAISSGASALPMRPMLKMKPVGRGADGRRIQLGDDRAEAAHVARAEERDERAERAAAPSRPRAAVGEDETRRRRADTSTKLRRRPKRSLTYPYETYPNQPPTFIATSSSRLLRCPGRRRAASTGSARYDGHPEIERPVRVQRAETQGDERRCRDSAIGGLRRSSPSERRGCGPARVGPDLRLVDGPHASRTPPAPAARR